MTVGVGHRDPLGDQLVNVAVVLPRASVRAGVGGTVPPAGVRAGVAVAGQLNRVGALVVASSARLAGVSGWRPGWRPGTVAEGLAVIRQPRFPFVVQVHCRIGVETLAGLVRRLDLRAGPRVWSRVLLKVLLALLLALLGGCVTGGLNRRRHLRKVGVDDHLVDRR